MITTCLLAKENSMLNPVPSTLYIFEICCSTLFTSFTRGSSIPGSSTITSKTACWCIRTYRFIWPPNSACNIHKRSSIWTMITTCLEAKENSMLNPVPSTLYKFEICCSTVFTSFTSGSSIPGSSTIASKTACWCIRTSATIRTRGTSGTLVFICNKKGNQWPITDAIRTNPIPSKTKCE